MSTHQSTIHIRMLLPLIAIMFLANCTSFYPFGASHNGHYFGGQGNATNPRVFVPHDLQREEPVFNHHAASSKKHTVISYP